MWAGLACLVANTKDLAGLLMAIAAGDNVLVRVEKARTLLLEGRQQIRPHVIPLSHLAEESANVTVLQTEAASARPRRGTRTGTPRASATLNARSCDVLEATGDKTSRSGPCAPPIASLTLQL